jgi:hypothetical protein
LERKEEQVDGKKRVRRNRKRWENGDKKGIHE